MIDTLDFDPAFHSHRSDPETSAQAAKSIEGAAGRHMAIILDVLKAAQAGLTSEEIAGRCDLDYLQVVRRISDLKRSGCVVDSGTRRLTSTRRSAAVWRAS